MSIIDNAKDVLELAKKGMTIELQEKIMQLREQAMSLLEENINLRSQVQELEAKLAKRDELMFSDGMYWVKKDGNADPVPFCQTCHDKDGKMVRLQSGAKNQYGHQWNCSVCNGGYGTYRPAPPITRVRSRSLDL